MLSTERKDTAGNNCVSSTKNPTIQNGTFGCFLSLVEAPDKAKIGSNAVYNMVQLLVHGATLHLFDLCKLSTSGFGLKHCASTFIH